METIRRLYKYVIVSALLLVPSVAQAIPAFARKYQTSCETCHTIYPKLTPFGEAFRRNGFRFPGDDPTFIKHETVPMGQDAYKSVFPNAVYPSVIPAAVPLAFGFNGQSVLHPDTKSGGGRADNGTAFTLNDLVAEGHVWMGGNFDEKNTFFGEVTFSSDGTIDVEHARVYFNDLFGPKHMFNLNIGRGFSNLTSFGAHSSYVADTALIPVSLTSMYGATGGSWSASNQFNGIELSGTIKGRFLYAIGVNAGNNIDIRPSESAYAHIGFKIGGMRLDGEGDQGTSNPDKPWAENALTVDLFGYRSASHYGATATAADGTMSNVAYDDETLMAGGGFRLQLSSFEWNDITFYETHDHADPMLLNSSGAPVDVQMLAHSDEISYIVYPWLVPAVRMEYVHVNPNGTTSFTDIKIVPGIAMLVRPNIKLTLTGQIEWADGAPDGGWGAINGFAFANNTNPNVKSVVELESVTAALAYAF